MPRGRITLMVALTTLVSHALAQTVTIDMTGMVLVNATDQIRTSSPDTLPPANGYSYSIDAIGVGNGAILGGQFPDPLPLAEILETLDPGGSRLLNGFVRNPAGAIPATVYTQTYAGVQLGVQFGFTFNTAIDAAGIGSIGWHDVSLGIPFLVGQMDVVSGTTTINVWEPTDPVTTEWHFDGTLAPVDDSGPALLRYLDDPAFGAPLEGTATGVTEAQSAFGTTTSFGLPDIDGGEATVYRTSPSRNNATPADTVQSRPIGLLLYHRTRDFFPDDKIGQWSMVWDMYIPASSWSAEYPVSLVESNHNNEEEADLRIRNSGGPDGTIGFSREPGEYLSSSLIGPDRWMRIAVVCDQYQTAQSLVYVDGTFVGASGSEWLYNGCDRTSPRYADGETVAPADWTAWGDFPNPWAMSSGTLTGIATPVASTTALFADRQGRGEEVYVANMLFTDALLTGDEIGALAGASADGIAFTGSDCLGDWDGNTTVDVLDLLSYLALWFTQDASANINGDMVVDVLDLLTFLEAWFAGCA